MPIRNATAIRQVANTELQIMTYAYPTFHQAIEAALAELVSVEMPSGDAGRDQKQRGGHFEVVRSICTNVGNSPFDDALNYFTAMTSTIRMSGSPASRSGATCASPRGISPSRWF